MAKRWYLKTTQYTLPAWNVWAALLDGLYINGELFEGNIPLQDLVVWISVQPDAYHIVNHAVTFNIAVYQNGTVNFLHKTFMWYIGQGQAQSDKIFTNGQPYGIGVNMFGVSCQNMSFPIANPIIYDTHFIMEVIV